jgi:hypothetical protein
LWNRTKPATDLPEVATISSPWLALDVSLAGVEAQFVPVPVRYRLDGVKGCGVIRVDQGDGKCA